MIVVVVEDDADIAALMEEVLREHEVRVVTDGFEGLFHVEPWDGVDAALVDITLPGVDGRTLLYWMEHSVPHVRRVCWSAREISADDIIHAHVVVQKPATADEIRAALRG